MANEEPWYAVRCAFRLPLSVYEERITLWRAASFEEAIALAETDARAYATETDVEYLGFAQAFHLFGDTLAPGMEVFSLIRKCELDPEEYASRFFAAGDGASEKT